MKLVDLRVKIFADGADLAGMLALYREPHIAGFTTNPTLMRKAGITDYRAFAHEVLAAIPDRSISFEVFSDEFAEMERQAREIASWGEHVYVKIPVTEHPRRADVTRSSGARRGRRQAERDGADDAGSGPGRGRQPRGRAPRATSRCSPAASPTPAAIRCR